MQARIVAASQGARWLADGWRIFRAAPLGWLVIAFLYLVFTQFFAMLPVVGVVSLLLVPVFTVGLMAGARAVSRGAQLDIGLLFDGFRNNLRPQLVLGAVYLACGLLLFAGVRLVDEEQVWRSILTGTRKAEEVELGEVLLPLLVFALIYTPITMMFWFSPPLTAWHAVGPVKALFFSFVACSMNWRALLAYGVAVAIVGTAIPIVTLIGITLASGSSSKAGLFALAMSFVIVLLPTLFASFYASYRDVFGVERQNEPGPRDPV